jgi:hypothetical protein
MSVPGSRVNASMAGCPCKVPAWPYSLVKLGRRGEGPGRENSLASLTNSLSHTRRRSVTRPVV